MKILTANRRQVYDWAFEWLLYLSAFTLPLVRAHWNSKVIIGLTVVWLLRTERKTIISRFKDKMLWIFIAPFLIDMIGMVHTSNVQYGLNTLVTKFTLLALPIILLSSSDIFRAEVIQNIFRAFTLGVVAVIGEYGVLIITTSMTEGFSLSYWLSDRLSNIPAVMDQNWIDIHPTYLSLYISMATFFILEELVIRRPGRRKAIIGILILFLFGLFQIWLNSRASLFGMGVAGLVFLAYYLTARQRFAAFSIIAVFSIVLFSLPFTRERLISAPLRAIQNGTIVDATDPGTWPISFRMQIMQCSVELLGNNHWIYGYGTGDYRDELLACYDRRILLWLSTRQLDAHCEYFAQVHRHGIIGLAVLLISLVVPFLEAVKKRSILYVLFLVLIMIACLPENLFSTQKGVVFYALFNAVLYLRMRLPNDRVPPAPSSESPTL